jgi:hypothetical protein
MSMFIDFKPLFPVTDEGLMIVVHAGMYGPDNGGKASHPLFGALGPRWMLVTSEQAQGRTQIHGHSGLMFPERLDDIVVDPATASARAALQMMDLALLPPQAAAALLQGVLIDELAFNPQLQERIEAEIARLGHRETREWGILIARAEGVRRQITEAAAQVQTMTSHTPAGNA